MEHIENGFTMWARKCLESEIFTDKPDKWFKIWFYLVQQVNHKKRGRYDRGQGFVRYDWIATATGASRDQIKHCIEFLKVNNMLATQKATRGMHITVCKYELYNTQANYKSPTESLKKATQKPHRSHTKHKNVNNVKKDNTTISPSDFMEYWNSKEKLPKIVAFSDVRKEKLRVRCQQAVFFSQWRAVLDKLALSPFHTGEGDRGWKAKVDWILENDNNFVKILELSSTTPKPAPNYSNCLTQPKEV